MTSTENDDIRLPQLARPLADIERTTLGGILQIVVEEFERWTEYLNSRCESPIEIALGTAILFVAKLRASLPITLLADEFACPTADNALMPQLHLEGMRIDFMLCFAGVRVCIECDGHDFHERTKEQARNDRSRDRKIQRAGYPILRFTGSEINASPTDCAEEIFEIIFAMVMHKAVNHPRRLEAYSAAYGAV